MDESHVLATKSIDCAIDKEGYRRRRRKLYAGKSEPYFNVVWICRLLKNGRTRVQTFTFIDCEKLPLRVSLWDEMIASEGHKLTEAGNTHAVVVAKRLTIKTYDCLSLSAKNSSAFSVNPPVPHATNLRTWFSTLQPSEIDHLRSTKTSDFTKELVIAGQMRTYSITEVMTSVPPGDYWVRAYMQISDSEQHLFYVGCGNCSSKIQTDIGKHYTCLLCNKETVATLLPIIVMSILDATGTIEAVAIEKVAERILQTTTSDLKRLLDMGQKLELGSLNSKFEGKSFLLLVRRTSTLGSDEQRRLLIQSYWNDEAHTTKALPDTKQHSTSLVISEGQSSSEAKEFELPISPLKRQMSNITLTAGTSSKKQLIFNKESAAEYQFVNADEANES